MTQVYSYAEKWSRGYREAIDPLTESDARARHSRGELYTVLVASAEHPSCFIEIVGENNYVGVNFLDDHQRNYLTYDFQRGKDGLLFLSGADFRMYRGISDDLAIVEQYRFKREGDLTVTITDLTANTSDVGTKQLDVAPNYEAWPEFGEYEQLIMRDRNLEGSRGAPGR